MCGGEEATINTTSTPTSVTTACSSTTTTTTAGGSSNSSSSSTGLGSQLVEVMALVLGNEEDEDGHLVALQMVDDLLGKAAPLLLEHCARLGVISKVASLAGPADPPIEEYTTPIKSKDDQVSWMCYYDIKGKSWKSLFLFAI